MSEIKQTENLWDTTKSTPRGKFLSPTSKNRKITNNLMMHPKDLEKQEQTKTRRVRIREETNKTAGLVM